MHLAELNVGYAAHALDDPRMAPFMENLDRVNALAERAPGFVWRLKSEAGNATDIAVPGDPDMIANLSVWEDIPTFASYVFNTVHAQFYNRRAEFFSQMQEAHFVMWWIEEGHLPDLTEAMARLRHLQAHGPSEAAFGWEAVDMSPYRRCAEAAE